MNKTVYNRAFEYIKAHPEEWDQGCWTVEAFQENNEGCGTACCIAGRVALMSGKPFDQKAPGVPSVKELAQAELEITPREANWLFAQDRTFPNLALVYRLGSVSRAIVQLEGRVVPSSDSEEA